MPYLKPKDRIDELLAAVIPLAARKGYARITRKEIADAAGVSEALVSLRLGTMIAMRRTVMRHAVKQAEAGDDDALRVVAQGLVDGSSHARKASADVQSKALASLLVAQP